MRGRSALRVVERDPFSVKEIEIWNDSSEAELHSLHYTLPYPQALRPEIPNYFIQKLSEKGAVVLDPFARGGVTALEANLLGRIAYTSDVDPLSIRVARAKVELADITEVTLKLQLINLKRPVSLDQYGKLFNQFYDIDTYRELVNLRGFVSAQNDRTTRFIELMALSLLHGHGAGYFSVYTFPQISLLPEEQADLNRKRLQIPDYRAVVPRILRRTAGALRDGGFSALRQMEGKNRFVQADPRNLSYASSASVDLVVTSPPLPGKLGRGLASDLWLKLWFAGVPASSLANVPPSFHSIDAWSEYMNECLFEMSRVVRPRGRAVLDLREITLDGKAIFLDETVMQIVNEDLSRFWEVEGLVLQPQKSAKIKDSIGKRENGASKSHRMLVLRRK